MSKIKTPIFNLCLIGLMFFSSQMKGQVVMEEFLIQDHAGQIEQSINYNGDAIDYQLTFVDKPSEVRSNYTLTLSVNGNEINTFDVRFRNLIVTFYVEIRLGKTSGDIKTLTGVYDKGNKWMRVKFAPQEGCQRDGKKWYRVDRITSFQEVLEKILGQLDENVLLDCYQKD